MAPSGLWFGDGEGIEIVYKSGKNLAYTEEDPKVDPRMTKHARGFDQALLKIGERSYLAYGWGLTSPMMVLQIRRYKRKIRPRNTSWCCAVSY